MSCNRSSSYLENPANSVVYSDTDYTRFWAKVDRSGACWLWAGARIGQPQYGAFSVARGRQRGQQPPRYAHRVAWEMERGPIPAGMSVLHRCDVPLCVNPNHLFLGTQRDNMRDASAKGRLHIPRPGRQKVTDAQVAEMVALRASGLKLAVIADRFNVTKGFVSMVARGTRRQLRRAA